MYQQWQQADGTVGADLCAPIPAAPWASYDGGQSEVQYTPFGMFTTAETELNPNYAARAAAALAAHPMWAEQGGTLTDAQMVVATISNVFDGLFASAMRAPATSGNPDDILNETCMPAIALLARAIIDGLAQTWGGTFAYSVCEAQNWPWYPGC